MHTKTEIDDAILSEIDDKSEIDILTLLIEEVKTLRDRVEEMEGKTERQKKLLLHIAHMQMH